MSSLVIVWLMCLSHEGHADSSRPFTIGTLQDPKSILPLQQQLGESNQLRRMLMPPILTVQGDGRVMCHLCKENPSFDLIRNEKTGETELAVNLVLKKKLFWGDGEKITREDVKFTLEYMALANYTQSPKPILPIRIIEFDKDQENKMRLVLRHKRSDSAQFFSISLLPKHKEQQIKALANQNAEISALWTALQDPGFYYGPYRLSKAQADSFLLVHNSKNEWEGSPSEDLLIRFFPGLRELGNAINQKELDQTLTKELSWSQYKELLPLSPQLREQYQADGSPSYTQELLLLNLRSPLLVNPQLRQALFHSIDRENLNKQSFQNLATISDGMISPAIMQRMNEKKVDGFNSKLSSYLLEQSGWHLKPDGMRYGDGQQKLSLTLTCTEPRLKNDWFAQVQNDFKKIGIELKLDLVPEADYLRQTLAHRRFKDLACMRWTIPPLSVPMQLVHSLAVPSNENDFVGQNFSGWEQPIVNRILENIMRENDVIHALRLYVRLEKQFQSEVPAIPLVYLPQITLMRKVGPDSNTRDIQKNLAIYGENQRRKL